MRIAVLGPPGAGKSRLGEGLAALLGVPFHDLDDLYWLPGWRRPADAEWERKQAMVTEGPSWVIAGNYQPTVELRLRHASVAVIVDPGPWICVCRLLTRTVRIYLGRTDLLPMQVRADGRTSAGHGLLPIMQIAFRYSRDGLPRTRTIAAAQRVPVIEVRHSETPAAVMRRLKAVLPMGLVERPGQ